MKLAALLLALSVLACTNPTAPENQHAQRVLAGTPRMSDSGYVPIAPPPVTGRR